MTIFGNRKRRRELSDGVGTASGLAVGRTPGAAPETIGPDLDQALPRTARWQLAVAIYLKVSVSVVAATFPLVALALSNAFHTSATQLGTIALTDLGIAALVNAVAAFFLPSIDWRGCAVAGSAMMAAGNALVTVSAKLDGLLLAQAISSIGMGLMVAVGTAVIGVSDRAKRGFAAVGIYTCLISIAFLIAAPAAMAAFGWHAIFGGLSLLALTAMGLSILGLGHVHYTEGSVRAVAVKLRRSTIIGFLGGTLTYLTFGVVNAYLAIMGKELGLNPRIISYLLILSFASSALGSATMAGPVFATHRSSVAFAATTAVFGTLLLTAGFGMSSPTAFELGVALFSFGTNVATVTVFALAADAGQNGAIAAIMSAVKSVGYAAGPLFFAPVIAGAGLPTAFAVSSALMLGGILLTRLLEERPETGRCSP